MVGLKEIVRGDKVAMVGFSGFKLGEFRITLATATYVQVATKTSTLTFDRDGKQINIADPKKAKFPNKILHLEDAKDLLTQEEARARKSDAPVKKRTREIEFKTKSPLVTKIVDVELEDEADVIEVPQENPKHSQYETIKTCILQDIPVYLVGEAGTGKNHTLQEIAEELKMEFYFTNSIQQEYKVTGFIDAGGKYHETEFYKAFVNGGLFFLDEIDASIPEVLVLLNAAIANRYFEFPNGKINAHPDFRVVAAGNTVGSGANEKYTGRLVLDSATLDRFAVIEFGYDRNIELSLAKGNNELVNFIRSLREFCDKNGIRGTFSYRMIISVQKLEEAKMPLKQIINIAVVKGLDKDTIKTLQIAYGSGKYAAALKEVQS